MPRRFFPIPILTLLLLLPTLARADNSERLIKVERADFHEKPSAESAVPFTISQFYPVEEIGREGEWVKVKTPKDSVGYIKNEQLTRSAYLSIKGKIANIRSGPEISDRLLFTLAEHYPVKVVEKEGERLKVVDYEGDSGWVHENFVSSEPYVIVRLDQINLREGPGTQHAKRFTAEKGVVFKVLDEKDGWLHVRHADGDEGWCSAKIVWGWLDD